MLSAGVGEARRLELLEALEVNTDVTEFPVIEGLEHRLWDGWQVFQTTHTQAHL